MFTDLTSPGSNSSPATQISAGIENFKASAKAWDAVLVMAPTWGSPSVAASLLAWRSPWE